MDSLCAKSVGYASLRAMRSMLFALFITSVTFNHAQAAPPTRCTLNRECDDQLFCNGEERCLPSDSRADARGCVHLGILPCASIPNTRCDETTARCVPIITGPCANPLYRDLDGDGEISVECGGTDCDDHDRYRSHSLIEQCSGNLPDGRPANNHDEDCNLSTVANPDTKTTRDGDADGDGHISNQCTNVGSTGQVISGDDCDDHNFSLFMGSQTCASSTSAMVCVMTVPYTARDMIGGYGYWNWRAASCGTGLSCILQPNQTGVCSR